tara:strand:- start:1944 stop:2687 length:744 start_codon:yes stop_codon:yes gene_type:complete
MIRFLSLIIMLLMPSCHSVISEFSENEEILDYTYYINEGWKAFESINLNDTLAIEQHEEYYDLALEMFNISIEAIQSEFSDQQFMGPYYQAYNGIGWSQLYYAGEFLDNDNIRDSLRNESIISFESAYDDLINSQSDQILDQDWCDMYLGLFYTSYYLGINDTSYFNSSLSHSAMLLSINPFYDFNHDQLDYKNIHYLRGKIYLRKQNYEKAYDEIKIVIDDCDPFINNELNINLLFDCFDQFSNDN